MIDRHGIIDLNVVPEDISGDWALCVNANISTEESVEPLTGEMTSGRKGNYIVTTGYLYIVSSR